MFGRSRKNSAAGDVARVHGQGAVEFGYGVRTQTQAQTGGGDGGKVGGVHIFLSEMYAVCTRFYRLAPMVVDKKLGCAVLTGGDATFDFTFQLVAMQDFTAQLHRVGTCFDHALDPVSSGNNGVKFQGRFEWREGHNGSERNNSLLYYQKRPSE